jgi:hypothetical protein
MRVSLTGSAWSTNSAAARGANADRSSERYTERFASAERVKSCFTLRPNERVMR